MLAKKTRQINDPFFKRQAMVKAAQPVLDIAKREVPVDTGALKDSLEIVENEDGARVQTDKEYAGSVEYLDHPYMRIAAKESARDIERIAAKEFKKQIEKN